MSENILQIQASWSIHYKADVFKYNLWKSDCKQVSQNMNKLVYSVTLSLLYILCHLKYNTYFASLPLLYVIWRSTHDLVLLPTRHGCCLTCKNFEAHPRRPALPRPAPQAARPFSKFTKKGFNFPSTIITVASLTH